MLNIVVPMAGKGSRFAKAGYTKPKPFIDTDGEPMILRVVRNLIPYQPHRFIFIARREHEKYIKEHMSFATNVIYLDEVTEGAACTVLLADNYINTHDQLIIANSDQLVDWNDASSVRRSPCRTVWIKETNNIQDMINYAAMNHLDASIATFNSSHPKWSYAKLNEYGEVDRVAEKKVISNYATVGIYYYTSGSLFVKAAQDMINKNIRVNGEFYVCPAFNELVSKYRIGIYPIHKMYGLGTPEDLEKYLNEK